MKKGGSQEDGKEEERGGSRGREEGRSHAKEQLARAALASSPSVQVLHLRPLPAAGPAPGASLPKTLPRRARIADTQPCFLGEHLWRHS